MKKKIVFILLLLVSSLYLTAQHRDTIVVTAHKNIDIQTDPSVGYTRYPEWALFPSSDVQYYKVIAYLTFECASGKPCGEWDYINHIRIGKTGGMQGDSLGWEIARFITPYGNYWGVGNSFKHGWYYDVTDFSPFLHDSTQIIYEHTGYENSSKGWKINLTFYVIPGISPLTIQKITPLWTGNFQYGNPENPIENHITTQNIRFGENAKTVNIKIIQTGHGMDETDDCAEFCEKWRTVKLDDSIIDSRSVWRECGYISLYPQAGTWLYDRANWCPGDKVPYHDVYLHHLADNSDNHNIELIMQPYTASGSFGHWTISSYCVEYGAPNYEIDASIEEVMRPSKEYSNVRINPICGLPTVIVKNNGSETLTTMTFSYGVREGEKETFIWNGNLQFLQMDTIQLPGVPNWDAGDGSKIFEIQILNVNNKIDQFPDNNTAYSAFNAPPVYPADMIILLLTNKAPSENYYYLTDLNSGEIVLYHNCLDEGFAPRTRYSDTLHLEPGCYELALYDDGPPPEEYPLNKDGLNWWANSYDGAGMFRINRISSSSLKQFSADFGTKIIYQFVVSETSDIQEQDTPLYQLNIAPNPATNITQILYDFKSHDVFEKTLVIKDLLGRTMKMLSLSADKGSEWVDVSTFPKGFYIVLLQSNQGIKAEKMIVY
jgi:hypothetical protein